MCIKMYRTSRGMAKVVPCTFDRETNNMLHKGGSRVAKRGVWDNYYTTWEEAKEEMVTRARLQVKACTTRLQTAETFLHKAQAVIEQ